MKLFPRHTELMFKAAVLYSTAGYSDSAAALAELGEQEAWDPATKARFRDFAATLPKVGTKTPAPEKRL